MFAFYRDQIYCANVVVAMTSSRRPRSAGTTEGTEQATDLRTIMLHMLEETARHTGHLEAARELLDGQTGLGPRSCARRPVRGVGGDAGCR